MGRGQMFEGRGLRTKFRRLGHSRDRGLKPDVRDQGSNTRSQRPGSEFKVKTKGSRPKGHRPGGSNPEATGQGSNTRGQRPMFIGSKSEACVRPEGKVQTKGSRSKGHRRGSNIRGPETRSQGSNARGQKSMLKGSKFRGLRVRPEAKVQTPNVRGLGQARGQGSNTKCPRTEYKVQSPNTRGQGSKPDVRGQGSNTLMSEA